MREHQDLMSVTGPNQHAQRDLGGRLGPVQRLSVRHRDPSSRRQRNMLAKGAF